ncbi:MAG: 16S rRNA (cytidine(1402)-2'-O)-methyltransferase [Acidimicrobiia bacterium]|nr:16S rRNA (cytidine(1402)-2'-O)-methyltransferase [Acidimicrobiia bacterium]
MPGTLFVVATPIGNLEDFSFRGVRTLREVDLIAAEDTRRTSKLLAHYEIEKPMVSLREHNEARESGRLVARLTAGENIALVSDAGTPGIADPGENLVSQARAAGIRVVPVPGANAIAAALSAAGLPADEFLFLGFPPSSGQQRDRWFEDLAASQRTTVFYEAPHRIARTIGEVAQYLVDPQIMLCREITKVNEELVKWNNRETVKELGEFVVVVGASHALEERDPDESEVARLFGQIADSTGLEEEAVIAMVATHFGVSHTRARKLIKKGRILLKRAHDNQEDL